MGHLLSCHAEKRVDSMVGEYLTCHILGQGTYIMARASGSLRFFIGDCVLTTTP